MGRAFSRAAAVAVAALAVAALAVAACGSQRVAPSAPSQTMPPAGGQDGPAGFAARARQVTAQWDRSAAARLWRTGLVLMDASDLTPVPPGMGFASQRDKDAFGSGHFKLAGSLPAGPLPGLVRWADGTTLRLPVLTAQAAFAELAVQRPCGGPAACGQLTVTGAQPGAVTIRTSRGPASVPAWRFTVAGLGWKVSEVAVARNALAVLPGYGPIPPAGQATAGVGGLTAVSPDGRTLILSFVGSACDAAWGGYRYESNSTVVAGSWEKSSAGRTSCAALGVLRTARVTLARPLGTRVILDVASGLPLVSGFRIPLPRRALRTAGAARYLPLQDRGELAGHSACDCPAALPGVAAGAKAGAGRRSSASFHHHGYLRSR